jgi:uncharacterized protein YfaS (alpha-2-macroglobulin family)
MKVSRGLAGVTLIILLIIPFLLGSSNIMLDEEDERFYLSNYQAFSPGSEIAVNLYRYNNNRDDEFSFRLFRISDVVKFFTGIDKSVIRYGFDIWGRNKESLLQYTTPIKEWRSRIPDYRKSYRSNVNVNAGRLNEPGIYVLQAIKGSQVAYCGIVVSDMAMLYKNSNKEIIAFAADAKTSAFQPNVRFDIYSGENLISTVLTGEDGVAEIKVDTALFGDNNYLMFARTGKETLVNDPYFYFNRESEDYRAYIYTSQPVYRPGQEVFFKAIMRKRERDELINMPGLTFSVTVKSRRNKEVYSQQLTMNDFGTISGSFKLDEDADLGDYTIYIDKGDIHFSGFFSVEEYKKPEYFVTVKTDQEQYAGKDVIKGVVTADYYFGSPVTNGTVTLNIYKSTYWRPWWYWSDYAWFYRSLENSGSRRSKILSHYGSQQVRQITGEFDPEGKFTFEYEIEKDVDFDNVYSISAQVTDYARRAITGSKEVYVTRGSFTLSTSPEKYFYKKGSEVKIRVNAADFSDKPVSTGFKIAVSRNDNNRVYGNKHSYLKADTLYGRTDAAGRAVVSFSPGYNNNTGYYGYTVIAADEKNRTITASGNFFVGNEDEYWHYFDHSGLEIITDKDSYEKGDSLIAYVFLPSENTQLLLTYETNRILNYKKYNVEGKSFTITEKLTDKHSPGFNIGVMFVKDRQFYSINQFVGVLNRDKILDIAVDKNKNEYKPGDEAIYNINVKDHTGKPVKNTELSFGIIDESVYAIKEDEQLPIQNFFYMPQHYYIPASSSLQANSYNGGSRKYVYADRNITYKEVKGNESLYGKAIYSENKLPAKGVEIIISSRDGYFKALADTSGNYRFSNIPEGRYEVLVYLGEGVPRFVSEVNVKGDKEYNINIEPLREYALRGNDLLMTEASDVHVQALSSVNGGRSIAKLEAGMVAESKSYVQAEVRSNFVDAALWRAHVITDENGKAQVKFKMPDNLTTWRATVKGITPETLAGEQKDKVITRKNLLVRMETPRFFREGDELTISTIIHNYLDEKKQAKISFKADNLELLNSGINTPGYSTIMFDKARGMYELNVNKNSELRIDWKVRVTSPVGEAVLNTEALTNEESDAVRLNIPILPKGYREVNALVSDFSDNNTQEVLEFNIPPGADLRTAKLSFNVAPSLAGTVLKALDDLVAYPYGCVEQTMSRFLPAVIAANTFKELNTPLKAATIEKLPDVVAAGLKRLYGFQHDDGGWGWWENDKTHPYMTAYVIYGLSLAKAAGYNIDEEILKRGIRNLQSQVSGSRSGFDKTTLSYIAYSLSSAGNTIDKKLLNDLIHELSSEKTEPYPLALLTIAAENIRNSNLANEFSGRLIKEVQNEKNYAYWGGKQFHYRWQDDKVQGTAFAVKALLKTGSNPELAGKAVKWLLMQKQGFSWRSTQETAAVIFALTDYLKVTRELNPDYTAEVYVNDKKVFDKHFTASDIFSETGTIRLNGLDEKVIKNGNNKIKIVKNGAGKLYFSGVNEYYSKERVTTAFDNKFKIRREYYMLRPEKDGGRIVYEKEKFRGKVKSGEDILVKTYVESDDDNLQYFMLEDMFPSGFEIVKETDNYTIEGENDYPYYGHYGYRPWRWFYADREYRDEKAVFFVTNTNREMEFSYIIKAQIPGRYNIMPASGSLMYYPEVNGSSGMVSVEVVE